MSHWLHFCFFFWRSLNVSSCCTAPRNGLQTPSLTSLAIATRMRKRCLPVVKEREGCKWQPILVCCCTAFCPSVLLHFLHASPICLTPARGFPAALSHDPLLPTSLVFMCCPATAATDTGLCTASSCLLHLPAKVRRLFPHI